ncbi:uncharacterized protein LOC126791648 isoform X2 [Argentina anserina]|uniref:uncharacterized protein LOC126791648 isoform X2 n=1 Tax=Argentina anserina TaxID=57926 RepID=UPI0021764386|nr:uncharacterized protein LOC126791648 isoform X2 [Potentilla anserina]
MENLLISRIQSTVHSPHGYTQKKASPFGWLSTCIYVTFLKFRIEARFPVSKRSYQFVDNLEVLTWWSKTIEATSIFLNLFKVIALLGSFEMKTLNGFYNTARRAR